MSKTNKGGKRVGAGRPKSGVKKTKMVRLSVENYAHLKKLKGSLTWDELFMCLNKC
jgi:hypothetical protein